MTRFGECVRCTVATFRFLDSIIVGRKRGRFVIIVVIVVVVIVEEDDEVGTGDAMITVVTLL